MANRRMISKSISTSRKLSKTSIYASLLFTWLIPHCDDGGNMDAESNLVRGIVFPLRPEPVEKIEEALEELKKNGLISTYDVEGEKFLHIEKWDNFQTLRGDRPDWRYPKSSVNHGETTSKPLVALTERNITERNLPPSAGKNMYKLQPDNPDKTINYDALEEESESKQEQKAHKGYDPKDTNLLLAWGAEKLGRKFNKPLKQKKHIADMLAASNTPEAIKAKWEELEEDDFWADKGIDFSIVASQIDKVKTEIKPNPLKYAQHRN